MSFSLSALLLLLTALASDATRGQFTLEDQESGGKCQGQVTACVVITQCGALLGLLPLIKSGNKKAKLKLLTSHCGFAGPLPMVCCNMKTGYQANKIIAKKINSKLITENEILKESSTSLITKTSTTKTEAYASEITKKIRSMLMLRQLKTRAEMVSAVETAPLTTKKSTITTTKKMTPTPPVTTKRTAIKGLETTPFTTPASVLRSTNKLSDRLEPHWNFFRIGF
eukprot:GFUD01122200.1.p1 GENE.GFUD01122200.1~~GFUD01122200.1.p1  ORF type:complete len:226 (+),score=60.84 GFUD01122200.1:28-705(+)